MLFFLGAARGVAAGGRTCCSKFLKSLGGRKHMKRTAHAINTMNTPIKTADSTSLIIAGRPSWRMRSIVVLLGLLVVCSLQPGCSGRTESNQSPLDAEARQKGEEYWYGNALTKCGGAYYAKDASLDWIYQFNDISIEMSTSKPTEASRLNGVEWSGFARLHSKTSRLRAKNLKWDEWKNGSVYPGLTVQLTKVKGRWLFSGEEKPNPALKRVDCSEVD